MKTSDYDYHLPEEQIASYPSDERDQSRLLVYNRAENRIDHRHFGNIIDYLDRDDFLVINTTRVMRARLFGYKPKTSGKFELLLFKQLEPGIWEALAKPGRKLKPGTTLAFEDSDVSAEVVSENDDGTRVIKFSPPDRVTELMESRGIIPLPPYIQKQRQVDDSDYERYQTVYASQPGSVAAPTAGLHFTPELLDRIRAKGIEIENIVLDIGWGTFSPVRSDDPREHKMESEHFQIKSNTAERIKNLKQQGKRLVAVGTTSVRALESWYAATDGALEEYSGDTEMFIYPPYEFKLVDKLITNFHLPKSTLLMLVAALTGREVILSVYNQAVQKGYRFFSYGDSMFIL